MRPSGAATDLPICGFSALLPRAPTFKSQAGADKVAEATSYAYLSVSPDGFFDASCMDLTHAKLDQAAALNFYAREPERVRQAFDGAALKQGDALIDGQAGVVFSFRHTFEGSDEWCAEYRTVFTDARAYYFGVSVRCRDDSRDAVDRFFASIRLASEAVVIQGPSATHPAANAGRGHGGAPTNGNEALDTQACAENGSCYGDIALEPASRRPSPSTARTEGTGPTSEATSAVTADTRGQLRQLVAQSRDR